VSTVEHGTGEFVWGPTIDAAACSDCGVCVDFCRSGVYEWAGDHVVVAHRGACIAGCSHCATLCEAGALTFPSLEELRARRQKD
jgi:NAD-dependent dihydropyrimidine dehydrogenase PreA subunit